MTPEAKARENIDRVLAQCGWVVQRYKDFDPSASRGIALTEVPLKVGTADYLLLADKAPAGIIEAKKEGTPLSGVAEQSSHYGENLPDFLTSQGALPFAYESTGVETFFRDHRDPDPCSRRLFAFHRPETFAEWIARPDTLRKRLAQLPFAHPLQLAAMRGCQFEAIQNLESSLAAAHPRALIQMATGAGKTYTACAFAYRLIKHAGAKRILFLVDRANLGRQAKAEFDQFITPDTGRKFTELYNVQHLASNQLDSVSRVTICTIVAEIEKQFSRLDAGIAALRSAQAKLKRYRAAVLKAACEGRIVTTEAELARSQPSSENSQPAFETGEQLLQRILAERRKNWEQSNRKSKTGNRKYSEPAAPDAANLPPIPESWTWASVDQLSSHITSGSRDWSQFYGKGTGTFILAQNVRPMRLDLTECQAVAAPEGDAETERTRVRVDDLLVTIVGAKTGDVCRVPSELEDHFVCQSVALLRTVLSACAKFAEFYLASQENGQAQWKKFIYGQGRPHLSFEQLRVTAIALPLLPSKSALSPRWNAASVFWMSLKQCFQRISNAHRACGSPFSRKHSRASLYESPIHHHGGLDPTTSSAPGVYVN